MCTFEHFSFMLCRVWHTEKENDKRNPDIVRFLFAVDLDRKFINAFADVMTNSHSNSYVWNVRTMRISRALDSQKKQNDIILYIHGGYPFVVDWMMSKKNTKCICHTNTTNMLPYNVHVVHSMLNIIAHLYILLMFMFYYYLFTSHCTVYIWRSHTRLISFHWHFGWPL